MQVPAEKKVEYTIGIERSEMQQKLHHFNFVIKMEYFIPLFTWKDFMKFIWNSEFLDDKKWNVIENKCKLVPVYLTRNSVDILSTSSHKV